MNPVEELLRIFENWAKTGNSDNARRRDHAPEGHPTPIWASTRTAVELLFEIQDFIDQSGHTEAQRAVLEAWKVVFNPEHGWNTVNFEALSEYAKDGLTSLAKFWNLESPAVKILPPDRLQALRHALQEMRESVSVLPDEFQVIRDEVLDLIVEAEGILDGETVSEVVARAATNEVIGAATILVVQAEGAPIPLRKTIINKILLLAGAMISGASGGAAGELASRAIAGLLGS